jgi:hypothetical protein
MPQFRSCAISMLFLGNLMLSCGGDSFESAESDGGISGAGGSGAGGSSGKGGSAGHGGGLGGGGGAKTDGGNEAGQDASSTCIGGTADCDGNTANGCETDVDNGSDSCGACGHSCLGGTCSAGKCQPVVLQVAGSAEGTSIYQDGSWVYFTVGKGSPLGAVGRASKNADTTVQMLGTSQGAPTSVVALSDKAYWVDTAFHQINGSAGQTVDLVTTVTTAGRAFTGTNGILYYNDLAATAINRVNVDGTGKALVATIGSEPTSMTITPDQRLYFSTSTAVYDIVMASAVAIFTGYNNVVCIRATSKHLGWADLGAGMIYGMALTDKLPTQLADGVKAKAVALDASHVYYASADANVIGRVPLAGGANEVLFANASTPAAIAVDEKAAYWISGIDGAVYKLAK